VSTGIWLAVGLLIGLLAGWAWTTWRLDQRLTDALDTLRSEETRRRQDLVEELASSEKRVETLATTNNELRGNVEQLKLEAKDREREVERAEARIFDRESTIDSLRSKLYASRNRATDLEAEVETKKTELEVLRERFKAVSTAAMPEAADDPLSSIVVDLGETLSVEQE
jgi:chromosome segregation ATPase